MHIKTILTDNGSQFTDRFTSKKRTPSGKHAFDLVCAEFSIDHRLIRPRHPQTNGMVERFNGRISELVGQTRFASAAELQSTLTQYLATYNHSIPQRALDHQPPIQALKAWHKTHPDLFVKKVYEHAGLDKVCLEIEGRYQVKFLEIGTDKDHVHFLVQSVPTYTVTRIVTFYF